VVTTAIRLRLVAIRLPFDCNSTALRPFDDLRYDRAAALRLKQINRSACLRLSGYATEILVISSRTAVESKSNRRCNQCMTD